MIFICHDYSSFFGRLFYLDLFKIFTPGHPSQFYFRITIHSLVFGPLFVLGLSVFLFVHLNMDSPLLSVGGCQIVPST